MDRYPKVFFILFVIAHLLADLAMPSLPGAFRFNPDESTVGVRAQAVQTHDFKPAPAHRLRESVELSRLAMKVPVESKRRANPPELVVVLPRRDPSSDRPFQRLPEDPLILPRL